MGVYTNELAIEKQTEKFITSYLLMLTLYPQTSGTPCYTVPTSEKVAELWFLSW